MARQRSRNIQSRNRTMLGAVGALLLVFVLIVAGLYYYRENYGASSSENAFDRAVADCVHDRTRVSSTSDLEDRATSDCVHDNTPDSDSK